MSDEPGDENKPGKGQRKGGNPPADHRWPPGKSGNPRGRPRKPKIQIPTSPVPTLHIQALAEAWKPVWVTTNGKREEIPLIRAVVRGLGVHAANGNLRAQLAYVEFFQQAEQRRRKEAEAGFAHAHKYKEKWAGVFERYDRAGEPRPEPVPHPDDIATDWTTGMVTFNGPSTEAEKVNWDWAETQRAGFSREIAAARKEMAKRPDLKNSYEADIRRYTELIEIMDAMFPRPSIRRQPGFDLAKWRAKHRELFEVAPGAPKKRTA
jgi:hypothetical protein